MERVSTRAAALAAFFLAAVSANSSWSASGFVIDDLGFKSTSPASDTFRFAHPLSGKLERADKFESEVNCRLMAPNPKSVWIGAWAPGFELYLPYGIELGLSSLVGPNLTVKDASFGPGTPTSATKWCLLTFSDRQPAVLFAFLGAPAQMIVEGSSGAWKVKTVGRYRGRVRVCLPFGLKPLSGNNVATLGTFAKVMSDQEAFWAGPRANLLATESVLDEGSATLRYRFDRPGAVIPPVAILAKAGGNALKTMTPAFDSNRYTEAGPIAFSTAPSIEFKFPLRRVPASRGVGLDTLVNGQPSSSSDTIAVRALVTMLGGQAPPRPDPAHDVAPDSSESRDVAAARLLQAVAQARAYGGSSDRTQVSSLLKGWNPAAWSIEEPDEAVRQRAATYLAIAAALEPAGGSELYGAMLNAGLDARSGMARFCESHELPVPPAPPAQPLKRLLSALYSDSAQSLVESPFCQGLLSPLRIMSDQSVTAASVPLGIELHWNHRRQDRPLIVLGVASPCTVFKGSNLIAVEARESFGVLTVRYAAQSEGECSLILKPQKWATPVPSLAGSDLFQVLP